MNSKKRRNVVRVGFIPPVQSKLHCRIFYPSDCYCPDIFIIFPDGSTMSGDFKGTHWEYR